MTKLELPTPVLICQGLTRQGQWPARCWIQWSVLSPNHLDPSAAFDSADCAQSEHTLLLFSFSLSRTRCSPSQAPLCSPHAGAPSCASASAPCVITSWLPVPRHPIRASSASPLGHRTAISGRVCPRASFGCFSPNPHLFPISLSGQPLPPGTRDRSQTLWSHPSLLSSSYLCPRHREIPWLLMWTHSDHPSLALSTRPPWSIFHCLWPGFLQPPHPGLPLHLCHPLVSSPTGARMILFTPCSAQTPAPRDSQAHLWGKPQASRGPARPCRIWPWPPLCPSAHSSPIPTPAPRARSPPGPVHLSPLA